MTIIKRIYKRKYIISFNYVWRLQTRQVQVFLNLRKIDATFMNLFYGNVSVDKGYSLYSRYLIPILTSFIIIRFIIIRVEVAVRYDTQNLTKPVTRE
jgi:hypothetical protein